ncbi:MAG: Asp-tRNA(Asn)/Glu-tRNA(Gln) amidotransferase subunit GatC [Ginsengibacter sp.]
MVINDELLDKLANLSRLEFNPEEKLILKDELEKMIGFFDKLNELDTENVEPLIFMNNNSNFTRQDVVKNELDQKDVFENATVHENQFFKVPKVINK